MLALMPDGSPPSEMAGLADEDDFLLERLAALVEEVDELPQSVIEAARAAFKRRAAVSSPGRAEAAIELGLLGLTELLGPSRELDTLTGRAATDVTVVAARARRRRAGDRRRRTPAHTTQVDVHTA